MNKDEQPGISFDGILLINERFNRVPYIPEELKIDINFETTLDKSDNSFSNETTTKLICLSDEGDDVVLELEFTFVGIFSIIEVEENMDIRLFMEQYSPAIIFPYIREHITSITQKAGISPILLPPLNILAMTKNIENNLD